MADHSTERERFRKALESLNTIQRESVLSDANTLQVLAGPGSGKTRGKLEQSGYKFQALTFLCISSYI